MPRKSIHVAALVVGLITMLVFIPGCVRRARTNGSTQQNDATGSLEFGGAQRTYLLHLPASYNGKAAVPLVFAFHGGGGDGQGMETLTHLNQIADEHSFMVVYPDGLNHQWNDGRPEINPDVDDVGFVSALIDELERSYDIDSKRIYCTGISNGGLFSYRLALELSNKIAAVAPVAAMLGETLSQTDTPQRPIPIMITMGTDDPVMPWDGGEIKVLRFGRGLVISEPATISFWVNTDGCSPTPTIDYFPDKDPSDGTRIRREVYSGGLDSSQVVLLAVEGGGHTWPGGTQYAPESIIGKTSRDIDAGELIWEFFQEYKM